MEKISSEKKDTGLSVALFISVVMTSRTNSMVSWTIPCTCGQQRRVYASWTRLQKRWLSRGGYIFKCIWQSLTKKDSLLSKLYKILISCKTKFYKKKILLLPGIFEYSKIFWKYLNWERMTLFLPVIVLVITEFTLGSRRIIWPITLDVCSTAFGLSIYSNFLFNLWWRLESVVTSKCSLTKPLKVRTGTF